MFRFCLASAVSTLIRIRYSILKKEVVVIVPLGRIMAERHGQRLWGHRRGMENLAAVWGGCPAFDSF